MFRVTLLRLATRRLELRYTRNLATDTLSPVIFSNTTTPALRVTVAMQKAAPLSLSAPTLTLALQNPY